MQYVNAEYNNDQEEVQDSPDDQIPDNQDQEDEVNNNNEDDDIQQFMIQPKAVDQDIFETPGNTNIKREATGKIGITINDCLDLLDLADGSELVNQVIQNADHKCSAQEIIDDITQIRKFIKTANFSRALSLLQNKLVQSDISLIFYR